MAAKSKMYQVKEMAPEDIEEVAYLLDVRKRLEEFSDMHPELVVQYQGLLDELTAAEQSAKAAVRNLCGDWKNPVGVTCGPVRFLRFNKKVDSGKAFETLGEEKFSHLGGRVETKVVYSLDSDDLMRAVSGGRIDKAVDVSRFLELTPVYSVEKL